MDNKITDELKFSSKMMDSFEYTVLVWPKVLGSQVYSNNNIDVDSTI
jgi:hypothetical protein